MFKLNIYPRPQYYHTLTENYKIVVGVGINSQLLFTVTVTNNICELSNLVRGRRSRRLFIGSIYPTRSRVL